MSEAYIKFISNLNSILKDKSTEEITKIYPNIKILILKQLEIMAIENDLNENDRNLFIEQKLKEFKIKGIPLQKYEQAWEEKNNVIITYKKLYDAANKLNIFPKKRISLDIHGNIIDIEVLDTGSKYIPDSNFNISLEIIQALDNLKDKSKEIKKEIKQEFYESKEQIIDDFNDSINIINKSL